MSHNDGGRCDLQEDCVACEESKFYAEIRNPAGRFIKFTVQKHGGDMMNISSEDENMSFSFESETIAGEEEAERLIRKFFPHILERCSGAEGELKMCSVVSGTFSLFVDWDRDSAPASTLPLSLPSQVVTHGYSTSHDHTHCTTGGGRGSSITEDKTVAPGTWLTSKKKKKIGSPTVIGDDSGILKGGEVD